jgi:hypothetical protein
LVLGDGSDIRITEVVLEEQINKPPLMILWNIITDFN